MNNELKEKLISMAETDQQVLKKLAEAGKLGTVEYHPKMREVHERNTDRLKRIIEKYGWPNQCTGHRQAAPVTGLCVKV